ncbi:14114_t:CDS:2, partial [Racocetra persica]
DTDLSMHMIISGNHVPQNIIHERAISRINLSREACDLAILNHRANKNTTKEVKMKLLASHNGALPNELQKLYNNQRTIDNSHELVTGILKEKGVILYYQQPNINVNEDIDEKYDLNSDSAQVLSLVVEDCRSRSKEEAIELGHVYELFIRTLLLPEITKECVKPMTTNNLTEQINKSIEGRHENSSQFIFEPGQ